MSALESVYLKGVSTSGELTGFFLLCACVGACVRGCVRVWVRACVCYRWAFFQNERLFFWC